ncbi:type III-B CRISPR module RAMP protein Cmr6 [Thermoactinomyces vulgaris]|uniref:type III-B CRISPR module RAMP protein Cmr6 n=1 Tax=Thermoactinomyces vulgaris TaxID=2026 RepID=UPI00364048EC
MKGELRYWYRAANPHYKKKVKPLGITQEEYLFGGANGKAGQSAFLMRFIEKTKGKGNSDFYKDKSFEIEFLLRPHLKQGKKPDPDWWGLLASIWLLGHFGGVGAKVRRGYGTIALEKWEAKNCEKLQSMIDNDFPILHNAKSLEDWEENLTRCWNNFVVNHDPNDEQSHTILDHHSSLFVSVVNDKCADKVWETALGVPYFPGSSVKGVVRTWAEFYEENDKNQEDIQHIFGSDRTGSEQNENNRQAGSVIFFDAIPATPIQLVEDVMTPHFSKYYTDPGNISPREWENPIPIPFLAVDENQPFLFAVAPREEKNIKDVDKVVHWLKEAMSWTGAGAKTAVGYGRFEEIR